LRLTPAGHQFIEALSNVTRERREAFGEALAEDGWMLNSSGQLVEEPGRDTRQNAPRTEDVPWGFETETAPPVRVPWHPRNQPDEVFPPMPPPVTDRPSGTTVITPAPEVPPEPASMLSSGVASADAAKPAPLELKSTPPRELSSSEQITRPPGLFETPFGTGAFKEALIGEPTLQPIVEPATLFPTEPDHASLAAALPDLPTQGPGPHFELTKTGVIDFVPPEALDRQGNNVSRLRQLHPTLRDLARELAEALGTGNIPHAHLAARIEEYRKQVDQTLDTIDFTRLYVEGVRLANAQKAAIEKVAEGELPPLRETDQEALETLLQLHGTFMLGTIAGVELIAAEQRYRRRPAEETEYRKAAMDFAASLQNQPDVINPSVAAFVLGAAEQIGQGANPERSGVVGTSTIQNVTITLKQRVALDQGAGRWPTRNGLRGVLGDRSHVILVLARRFRNSSAQHKR
jgi:hypothetical protein